MMQTSSPADSQGGGGCNNVFSILGSLAETLLEINLILGHLVHKPISTTPLTQGASFPA